LLEGSEPQAFQFLDALRVVRLAVSLGGTESLASHPASMTHADVDAKRKQAYGIGDNLVRLSIGIEDPRDLVADVRQALDDVEL
jgi:methionine-gamma-lyase